MRPEGTEDQYVTSTGGEDLGRNVYVRRSERIRNSPQRYNLGFGASRECKNYAVASIVHMLQDKDININVDKDDIILLLYQWDAEDCMDTSSTFQRK